jgi:small subunit ribosomal protein S16
MPVEKREQFRVVKLRLRRMGAKKRPSYRIVAADSRSPRDGAFIESFGFYDPITDPATINVKLDRARHWLSVGAQPTDTVRSIFTRAGVYAEASE